MKARQRRQRMFTRLCAMLDDFEAGWYSESCLSFLMALYTLDYLETRSFKG